MSFRFAAFDGVSVEARKWAWALGELGFSIRWVAGAGDRVDRVVPGLGIDATDAPDRRALDEALDGVDLVVVENLLSLPLNQRALEVVAAAARGRPTIVRHHDLPWQRARFAGHAPPPDDPAWVHITINDLSRRELAQRGIDAITLYNRFAPLVPLGLPVPRMSRPVLLHPTRAIPRKNVPAAVRLAEQVGATYWLLGPAEDGYADELEALLGGARCPVVHGGDVAIGDAYEACDVVVYPSLWEGFGNPTIESALARRPLVVGRYPVADELRRFGFRWLDVDDVAAIERVLRTPDVASLDQNEEIALAHFSLAGLPDALRPVLERVL